LLSRRRNIVGDAFYRWKSVSASFQIAPNATSTTEPVEPSKLRFTASHESFEI
jgi:hypothetical protein